MGKKSIGILIYANPDHYPPTINAVHLLSEHFDVILVGRNQGSADWQYPANVKIHRLGKYTSVQERERQSAQNKLWEYIHFVLQASHLIQDVSLIYAYDAFGYTAACLCQLIRRCAAPLIYHNHDLNEHLFPLSSLSGWIQRSEQRWAHKADLIVFPSQARVATFKNFANYNGPTLVMPNFPRKSYFQKHQNFDRFILKRFQEPQLLLQGTISRKSSLVELIHALTYLDQSIALKLIGSLQVEEKQLMQELSNRNQVADRVNYVMLVPYSQLPVHTWEATIGLCLYKELDINHQTMGTASNKIYEYAACGLPVIVSNLPDCREYLSDEVWIHFADPDDPRSIAAAAQNILNDFEKYQMMCLAARQAFEERFNYETVFAPLLAKIIPLANYNHAALVNQPILS